MTIPFLDALLPPTPARSAPNGTDQAAAGVFGALLAGLEAGQAVLPAEEPLARLSETLPPIGKASPETAVPPTGKALPGAALPPTGKALPDGGGVVRDGGLADPAIDLLAPDTDEKPPQSAADSAASPVLVPAPDPVATVPVAALAPAGAAVSVPAPASSTTTAPPEADAPGQQPAAAAIPTRQPSPVDARGSARGERLASQFGHAPAATSNPEAPPSSAASAPSGTEAPRPVQSYTPGLTILPSSAQPTGARPTAAEAAPTPSKRARESKLTLFTPASSPEPSPAAIVAAPVPVPPGSPVGEAAPAPSQAPAQPIALPDHRALVEALVRARAERDPGVSVALETREFGAVALRFETLQNSAGERGLQIALSSGDPGFERAVASAAAAQAALADQSGRNPASRGDPLATRSADASGNHFGNDPGGRASSSDPQFQHRPGSADAWREPRSRHLADRLTRDEEHGPAAYPVTPRADRRRGSIFA